MTAGWPRSVAAVRAARHTWGPQARVEFTPPVAYSNPMDDYSGRTLTADLSDASDSARALRGPFLRFGGETVCLGPVEVIATDNDNSLVARSLREAGDGRVLLVDNAGSRDCAMVGGDLARAAHENGWLGIVVHGAVRDTVELREVPIAIYARGTCPRKSIKRGIGTLDEAVTIDEVTICRGDILAVDEDGVVVVPAPEFDGL